MDHSKACRTETHVQVFYACLTICLFLGFCQILQAKTPLRSMTSTQLKESQKLPYRWELRIAPLAVFARWYAVDLSYRMTPRLLSGPSLISYDAQGERGNMFLPTKLGQSFGWNFYFEFAPEKKETWYSGLHTFYDDYRSYHHPDRGRYYRNTGLQSSLTLGRRVNFYLSPKSNLVCNAGVGLSHQSHQVQEVRTDEWYPYPEQSDPRAEQESFGALHFEFKAGVSF